MLRTARRPRTSRVYDPHRRARTVKALKKDRWGPYKKIADEIGEEVDYVRRVASEENLLRKRQPLANRSAYAQPAAVPAPVPAPVPAAVPRSAYSGERSAVPVRSWDVAHPAPRDVLFGERIASRAKGGRYVHPVTGVRHPSVTKILGTLNKPGINYHQMRLIARAAVSEPYNPYSSDETEEEAEQRFLKARSGTSSRGTSVHKAIQKGLPLSDVPEEQRMMVAAARRCLRDMGLREVAAEITIWGEDYTGSADMVVQDQDGRFAVIDWKTTTKEQPALWGDAAVQVAAYSGAEFMAVEGDAYPVEGTIDYGLVVCLAPNGLWQAGKVDVSPDSEAMRSFKAVRALYDMKQNWKSSTGLWESRVNGSV